MSPELPAFGIAPDCEPLEWLTADAGDDLEVLVDAQDGWSAEFGGRGDDEVWDRWCPVLAAIGEKSHYLDRAILDGRGLVLDRHGRSRRLLKACAQAGAGPGGVADLKPGDGRNPD